jgi:hypothetical protein
MCYLVLLICREDKKFLTSEKMTSDAHYLTLKILGVIIDGTYFIITHYNMIYIATNNR